MTTSEQVQRFTVDGGEPCTLAEFLADNECLDDEDVAAIRALPVGGVIDFGGGAFASMPIVRVS